MDKVGGSGAGTQTAEGKLAASLVRARRHVTGEDPFDASPVAGVEVLTALGDCSAVAARVGLRSSVISKTQSLH
jgi:hypothetical protein